MSNIEKTTAKLAGLQIDLLQKITNGKISLEELFGFLNMNPNKRKEVFGIAQKNFIVSSVFGNRISGQSPQWMSDDFLRIVFNPSKDMVITLPEVVPELKYYTLPRNMNDTTIQKESGFKTMTLEEYWLACYILLVTGKADKSKYYIFHVRIGEKVFTLGLCWNGDEWCSSAHSFDYGNDWIQGGIAVSLL